MTQKIAGFQMPEWMQQHQYFSTDEKLALLKSLVEELVAAGMPKLVKNFFDRNDPQRAMDFLFEMWFARGLLHLEDVTDLEYEPPLEQPDFRFKCRGVEYNVQVKRMTNLTTEQYRRQFLQMITSCPPLKEPWFINLELKKGFKNKHFNEFLRFLKANSHKFKVNPAQSNLLGQHDRIFDKYVWPEDEDPLIYFSFMRRRRGESFSVGIVTTRNLGVRLDSTYYEPARKSVEALLKKSSKTLRELSPTVCSLVAIQPTFDLELNHESMVDVLYGTQYPATCTEVSTGKKVLCELRHTDGLFRSGKFSRVAAILFVESDVNYLTSPFCGSRFPNRINYDLIQNYTIPLYSWQCISEDDFNNNPVPMTFRR